MHKVRLAAGMFVTALIVSLLATPPAHAGDPGYTFYFTARNGQPIGPDPCAAHPVWINPRNGTPAMVASVKKALPRISQQTGYTFFFAGLTNQAWDAPRTTSGRSPSTAVQVGFSSATRTPQLRGKTAGWTRVSLVNNTGRTSIANVQMVLDAGDFKSLTRRGARMRAGKGRSVAYRTWFTRSLVPHEFGHALGLSHTSNRGQLMSPRVTARGFQAGDLVGIAKLARQTCRK
ncbi:MAG: matrixin family metalloprotease [Nocardioidaceae bacterium]